jgi:hypothetical protein
MCSISNRSLISKSPLILDAAQAHALLSALPDDPALRELARTPLTLVDACPRIWWSGAKRFCRRQVR